MLRYNGKIFKLSREHYSMYFPFWVGFSIFGVFFRNPLCLENQWVWKYMPLTWFLVCIHLQITGARVRFSSIHPLFSTLGQVFSQHLTIKVISPYCPLLLAPYCVACTILCTVHCQACYIIWSANTGAWASFPLFAPNSLPCVCVSFFCSSAEISVHSSPSDKINGLWLHTISWSVRCSYFSLPSMLGFLFETPNPLTIYEVIEQAMLQDSYSWRECLKPLETKVRH